MIVGLIIQRRLQYSGYSLIWNDEFNYNGSPLESKWHLQYIPIDGIIDCNEKQHYTTRTKIPMSVMEL